MLEHQRSILATLGIDIWVPQAENATRHYNSQLYRDQAPQPQITPIVFDTAIADVTINTPAALSQAALERFKENIQRGAAVTPHLPPTTVAEQAAANEVLEQPIQQIPAFEVQALSCRAYVILVDASALNTQQQGLWHNIQKAVSAAHYELKWPFPFQELQDGRGASFYVQGFVDVLKNEKKIICLGKIPYMDSTNCIELASLEQMLAQPILKRRLWNFIKY